MKEIILLFYNVLYLDVVEALEMFPFLNYNLMGDVNLAEIIGALLSITILFMILYLPLKYLFKIIKKLVRI